MKTSVNLSSTCAPKIQESNKKIRKRTLKRAAFAGTCFSDDDLHKIIREWNTLHPRSSDKILLDMSSGKPSSKVLWNAIANKIATPECKTEYCWVKKRLPGQLSKKLIENFRPEMPSSWHRNNTEWLSTSDIEDVMEQYQDEFDNFTFRGAVPIDFDKVLAPGRCVSNEVCTMNLKKLKTAGKTKIGIVFNLDEHNKPGSHWIAMFIDLENMRIGFWDSYGFEPPVEVIALITRMQSQAKRYWNRPLDVVRNKKRHQYKTSECGMYCIYFISQLLEGNTFEQVYSNIIRDDQMNHKRAMFFSIDK
jgi:hypothetical protein